jgi:hypothetical protein
MLSEPDRAAPVLAAMLNVTVPGPVPLVPPVTETNPIWLDAVHGQVLPTLTLTAPPPPPAPALIDVGDNVAGQLFTFGGGGVSGWPVINPAPVIGIE